MRSLKEIFIWPGDAGIALVSFSSLLKGKSKNWPQKHELQFSVTCKETHAEIECKHMLRIHKMNRFLLNVCWIDLPESYRGKDTKLVMIWTYFFSVFHIEILGLCNHPDYNSCMVKEICNRQQKCRNNEITTEVCILV